MRRPHITFPAVEYREGTRGYQLRIGRLRVPQSSYLLAAAFVVGILGGYGAIGFRWLIREEAILSFGLLEPTVAHVLGPLALLVVLAVGGVISSGITQRFAPEARGHGVPEVMAAVALHGGVIRPRVIAIKAIASATCISFGGSVGREGPIVQIGSAVGSVLGQLVHAPAPIVRTLVACGAAAGISATFNAPIGGVFFASEVILGDFAPRSFATIVVSSVLAAVISRTYLGNYPSFDAREFTLVSPRELVLYALLGIVCAFWAWGFVKMLYWFEDGADRIKLPAEVKGALGFAVVGVIGLGFPEILGVGYDSIDHVLSSHVGWQKALELSIMKPIATSITLGAGGSGGVFAPSLFTGAMIGDAFGRIVHDLFPTWTATGGAYGLVAMAAVFAAAAEAPITSIVIVFEMSTDYTIVLPLMIATVIATILGRRLLGSTVYEMKLQRRGIDWKRVQRPRALSRIDVASVERVAPIVASPTDRVADVVDRLHGTDEAVVPIVGPDGAFLGVVMASELGYALAHDPGGELASLVKPAPATLDAGESLERAADLMTDPAIPMLPVLDPDQQLVGVVTRRDVLDAYRSLADI